MDIERAGTGVGDRVSEHAWTLLPTVVVRSAGFPWELVLSLAYPRAAESAAAVVRLERQALDLLADAPAHGAASADARPAGSPTGRTGSGRLSRGLRGRLRDLRPLPEGAPGPGDWLASWNEVTGRLEEARLTLTGTVGADAALVRAAVDGVVADERFLDALVCLSPGLYRELRRGAQGGRLRRRLAGRLQALSAKCGTAGCFGPINYAVVEAGLPGGYLWEGHRECPRRVAYPAARVGEALQQRILADPELVARLVPRRKTWAGIVLDGAAFVGECDGDRTLAEIAAGTGTGLERAAAALAVAVRRGLITHDLCPPATIPDTLGWLRERLEAAGIPLTPPPHGPDGSRRSAAPGRHLIDPACECGFPHAGTTTPGHTPSSGSSGGTGSSGFGGATASSGRGFGAAPHGPAGRATPGGGHRTRPPGLGDSPAGRGGEASGHGGEASGRGAGASPAGSGSAASAQGGEAAERRGEAAGRGGEGSGRGGEASGRRGGESVAGQAGELAEAGRDGGGRGEAPGVPSRGFATPAGVPAQRRRPVTGTRSAPDADLPLGQRVGEIAELLGQYPGASPDVKLAVQRRIEALAGGGRRDDRVIVHEAAAGTLRVTAGEGLAADLRGRVPRVLDLLAAEADLTRRDTNRLLAGRLGAGTFELSEALRATGDLEIQYGDRLSARIAAIVRDAPPGATVLNLAGSLDEFAPPAAPVLCTADVMVAAPSLEAYEPGTTPLVLGALHDAVLLTPWALQFHADSVTCLAQRDTEIRRALAGFTALNVISRRTNGLPPLELPGPVLELGGVAADPRRRRIGLDELYVHSDGIRAVLHAKGMEEPLLFHNGEHDTALHTALSLPRIQPPRLADLPRVPRLTWDNVVISRRRWRIGRASLDAVGHATGDRELLVAMARLRETHDLPVAFFATSPRERKPVYVDTRSPALIEVLGRLAEAADRLTVTEVLPGPEECWLRDGEQRFAAELRCVYLRPAATARDDVRPGQRHRQTTPAAGAGGGLNGSPTGKGDPAGRLGAAQEGTTSSLGNGGDAGGMSGTPGGSGGAVTVPSGVGEAGHAPGTAAATGRGLGATSGAGQGGAAGRGLEKAAGRGPAGALGGDGGGAGGPVRVTGDAEVAGEVGDLVAKAVTPVPGTCDQCASERRWPHPYPWPGEGG